MGEIKRGSGVKCQKVETLVKLQGAAYVFERLSEATVRPELYFFDFQRFLA